MLKDTVSFYKNGTWGGVTEGEARYMASNGLAIWSNDPCRVPCLYDASEWKICSDGIIRKKN